MLKKLSIFLVLLLLVSSPVLAENYTVATGTAALSGDNTLISAPAAGLSIVIHHIQIQNESSTSTVAILKAGSTAIYRGEFTTEGSGIVLDTSPDSGNKWKLAPATALVLNLSGANSHNYTVWYTVERIR